jgi:hypothetical protein
MNHFSTRRLRELKWTGSWRRSRLRVKRGRAWTLYIWCLIASVTTVFPLGLTYLVVSLLTWFPVSPPAVCICGRDKLLLSQSPAYPEAPVLLITDSPALILLTFNSTFACLAGGHNWNALELSACPRGLHACSSPRSFPMSLLVT